MKEYERKQLLERVARDGATVGMRIPETIDLQGEPFELKSFVFETKRLDSIPPDHRDEVERVKKRLRKERTHLRQRLEKEDITREDGDDIVEAIVGIDRALNALESLGETDLTSEEKAKEMADTKRWLSFLKEALGHGDDDRGPGVGRR